LDLKKNPTGHGSDHSLSKDFNPYHQPAIYEQTNIVLNQWLRSVGELIIHLHKSSRSMNKNNSSQSFKQDDLESCEFVNICYRKNPNDTTSVNKPTVCDCVMQIENLKHTYFVNFFINSLNGNFFKLKHLLSYLNEQIEALEQFLLPSDISSNTNNKLTFTANDLKNPLEISHKSLLILTECQAFLSSKCIIYLFKRELQKFNQEKKLSIYFNFFSNKNFLQTCDYR